MESEELQMDDVMGTKELSGNCQGTVRELSRGGRDQPNGRCGAGYQVRMALSHGVRSSRRSVRTLTHGGQPEP